jgi:hypothetical protein
MNDDLISMLECMDKVSQNNINYAIELLRHIMTTRLDEGLTEESIAYIAEKAAETRQAILQCKVENAEMKLQLMKEFSKDNSTP